MFHSPGSDVIVYTYMVLCSCGKYDMCLFYDMCIVHCFLYCAVMKVFCRVLLCFVFLMVCLCID